MRLALLILNVFVFSQVLLFSNSYKMDRCKPPQFVIATEGVKAGDFILQKTEVTAKISGVIADVTVKQIYENKSSMPLEAVYQFPTSSKAAVYAMQMTIGKRTIIAEIKKKNDARQIYETAKSEGKRTSLLEQDRPNLFTMNVANIVPGDIIEVEMKYTEILEPVDKIYSFVYPTVAGPRYGSNADIPTPENTPNPKKFRPLKTDVIEEPSVEVYLPQGVFDLTVEVASPFPISEINCSENTAIIAGNEQLKTVKMQNVAGKGDILVNYRLAGNAVNSGLMLYNDGKENYFMLTIQPPARVIPEQIPPREYIFVLDVSGSMDGFPTVTSKKLMVELIKSLKPTDKFNLILFASGFSVFSEKPVKANMENLEKVFNYLDSPLRGGGTELLPALNKALEMSKGDGISRSVVILTDGLVSFEREAFDLVRSKLDKQNVFCFGIGSSVNEYVLKGIAHAGEGESYIVEQSGEATEAARNFIKYISSPIMTDIKVNFNGFAAKDVEPKVIPDLFAEKPIVVYGKYDGKKTGYLQISGITGTGQLKANIDISHYGYDTDNNSLKYLWARNQIRQKYDYLKIGVEDSTIIKEITDLSLKYSLMSDYTSFVAVDYEIAVEKGNNEDIRKYDELDYIERSSSDGGIDLGGFSSNIDFSDKKVTVKSKTESVPDEYSFMPIETEAEVGNMSNLLNLVVYPKISSKAPIQGKVIVNVFIEKNGKPKKAKIVYSDNEILNQSAIDAVMSYQGYIPATQNNVPVGTWFSIPIEFEPDGRVKSFNVDNSYQSLIKSYSSKPQIKTFILNGKTYELNEDANLNMFHLTDKNEKSSRKIKKFDNVKIKFKIYQADGVEVQNGEFEFMQGIGEIDDFLDKYYLGLSVGSKGLILFDKKIFTYKNAYKLPLIDDELIKTHSLLFEFEIIEIK